MSHRLSGPWIDPDTGRAISPNDVLIDFQGVPLLVPRPEEFAARHLGRGAGLARVDWLPVDAPDPISPHLPPEERAPPGPLRAMIAGLPDPAAVCAAWGADFAPDGPMVDVGCGVGVVARLAALDVAAGGRSGPVLAFDRSPSAVLLAQNSVHHGDQASYALAGRRALCRWPRSLAPLPAGAVEWAVGDALRPPIAPGAVAWLHLGNLLDMVPEGMGAVLEALAPLLLPGGLLTLSTPFDEDATAVWGSQPTAEAELRAAYEALGLHLVAEEDPVYWLIREYDRGYRLLLCRCLALRKPLPTGPRGRATARPGR